MSSGFVSCPFEDCKYYGKLEYAEIDHFKRHLALEHDDFELLQLAFQKGIISKQYSSYSLSFVIRKISKLFTFRSVTK